MCVSTIYTDDQQYDQLRSGQTVQPAIMLSPLQVMMNGATPSARDVISGSQKVH